MWLVNVFGKGRGECVDWGIARFIFQKVHPMLSPASIARYVTARRIGQLLEAVIANGQYLPVMIKVWFSQVGQTPALALGLKRVVELSRRPTPAAAMLTETLLGAQAEDGSFDHDPAATAVAASALFHLLHDHHAHDSQVASAHERAIAWLMSMQSADGLFYDAPGFDQTQKLVFSAYILQLLVRDTLARTQLSLEDLLDTLSHQAHGSDRDTQSFLRIAQAGLPRTHRTAAA